MAIPLIEALHRSSNFPNRHTRFLTEMGDKLIILVIMDVLDFMNARRQKNATAYNTGIVRNVRGASHRRYSSLRTIRYRILFCMHGRLLMPISHNRRVFASREEPIVSLTHNTIRVNKDTSHMKTFTGASLRRYLHDFLKILVPRRSHLVDNTREVIRLNCLREIG